LTNGTVARLIAIDYGTKRVGLAATDPLQLIALGLDTVHANDVLAFLKAYAQREAIEAFVVGMPRRLDGTATDATPHVRGFIKSLKKAFPETPVHEHDERFTSVLAQRAMLAGGLSKKDRRDKATVDKVSATILLQSFMESRR
jgi:putative Holliday junction resolvase